MIFAKWLGAVEWSFGRIGTNERKNATRGDDAVILRSDFSDASWYNPGSDLRSLYRCCPVVLIERLIPEYNNNNNNNKNAAKISSSPWVPATASSASATASPSPKSSSSPCRSSTPTISDARAESAGSASVCSPSYDSSVQDACSVPSQRTATACGRGCLCVKA